MLSYNYFGTTLSFNLDNKFVITTTSKYIKEKNCYEMKIFISKDDIDLFDLIPETFDIKSSKETVSKDISAKITELLRTGFFEKYFIRYDEQIKCFEMGCELEEQQRLREKSYKPIKRKLVYQTVYYCGKCKNNYLEFEHIYCPTCGALIDWNDIK